MRGINCCVNIRLIALSDARSPADGARNAPSMK
jgi:hypothetical protein